MEINETLENMTKACEENTGGSVVVDSAELEMLIDAYKKAKKSAKSNLDLWVDAVNELGSCKRLLTHYRALVAEYEKLANITAENDKS